MKKKKISLLTRAIGAVAFLSLFVLNIVIFVKKEDTSGTLSFASLKARADGGEGSGSGWGYSTNTVQCPSPAYDATVTTVTNTGTSGGVYVNAGGTIPGTNVTAGVGGTYYTGEGSSTLATYKTPTYKDDCVSASWYNYCTIKGCSVRL